VLERDLEAVTEMGVLIRDSLWAPGIRVPKSMFRSRRAGKSSSVCKGSEMGAGRCIPMPA
jgi:hypothetical protein